MQAQDVARRISGTVAGESAQKFNIPSTHHNPYLSHYIICHLPLVFLSPQFTFAILFVLSLSILPLFSACLLFACVLVCLLAVMASLISSLLSPESEVLNFKQREGENLKDAWYRICNAQNRSTRKKLLQFFSAIFM